MILEIEISKNYQRAARELGVDREAMTRGMARGLQEVTRDHLITLAATRHDTAARLGANPTGHLGKAAEAVSSPAAIATTADTATLSINWPGLSRAFHSVRIVPRNGAKFLAIPANALAYGHSPREFSGLVAAVVGDRGVLMFPEPGKRKYRGRRYKTDVGNQEGRDYDTETVTGGRFGTVMFILKKSVTQKQDRTLLPSDEQWTQAAKAGALRAIRTAK